MFNRRVFALQMTLIGTLIVSPAFKGHLELTTEIVQFGSAAFFFVAAILMKEVEQNNFDILSNAIYIRTILAAESARLSEGEYQFHFGSFETVYRKKVNETVPALKTFNLFADDAQFLVGLLLGAFALGIFFYSVIFNGWANWVLVPIIAFSALLFARNVINFFIVGHSWKRFTYFDEGEVSLLEKYGSMMKAEPPLGRREKE